MIAQSEQCFWHRQAFNFAAKSILQLNAETIDCETADSTVSTSALQKIYIVSFESFT
tara:strand:- start:189 stop:359 length:171 start_codon:yes stop_codon:yes gene_type:complete